MIDPVPPMTACELHELFCRYIENEAMASARVAMADFVERETLERLQTLRALWTRLYGRRNIA